MLRVLTRAMGAAERSAVWPGRNAAFIRLRRSTEPGTTRLYVCAVRDTHHVAAREPLLGSLGAGCKRQGSHSEGADSLPRAGGSDGGCPPPGSLGASPRRTRSQAGPPDRAGLVVPESSR